MGTFHIDEIRSIEKITAARNTEWYYHAFSFLPDVFKNMVSSGIKCPFLIGTRLAGVHNGFFFISLSKEVPGIKKSAFLKYLKRNSMFILDNIEPFKCFPEGMAPIPIITRESTWSDEYQAFMKIPAKKIVGLESAVESWSLEEEIEKLRDLREMIIILNELNISWPIYDYSHYEEDQIFEIDKQGYLELSKKLV
ncbi:MAG: hypothetical protein J1F35_02350 [Erysipelotrichales bacterium]|nr:hypothetical protein [Erysipelotrichales bacterium]